MSSHEVTTESLLQHMRSERAHQPMALPTEPAEALRPYTHEEEARMAADWERAQHQEAARWAANTIILAAQKIPNNVISITEAPSYDTNQRANGSELRGAH